MNTVFNNILTKIKENKKYKIFLILITILFILLICFYFSLTLSKTSNKQNVELFIYQDYDFNKVFSELKQNNILKENNFTFNFTSKILSYNKHIKAGRYVVEPNTSIIKLVKKLRTGSQTPVKIVISNCRTEWEFCKKITANLMISDTALHNQIMKMNFKYPNEIFYYVIPNTYEIYWNISAKKLLDKLANETKLFWSKKAQKLKLSGFNEKQIIIIASIVNEETNKDDEKSQIAGVYINRLKKNMLLQADPTVKFAVGDFSLKRIKGEHLQIDSPFNTYKNLGLPPAPICLPSIASIYSTLKYDKHDYIYFCAKEDFSGYHNFAATLQEHAANAIRYRKALNARGIN